MGRKSKRQKPNSEKYQAVRDVIESTLLRGDSSVEEACKVSESLQDESLYKDIKNSLLRILNAHYNDVKIHFYGSRIIGVGKRNSDLDIFVEIDGNFYSSKNDNRDRENILDVNKILKDSQGGRSQWDVTGCVYSAKVPVIKANYLPMGVECDITVSNGAGYRNTMLMKYLFDLQPEAKRLFHFLKLVLPHIDENFDGYLLKVLTIVCLQIRNMLPTFPMMQNENGLIQRNIDGWPVHFDDTHDLRFYRLPVMNSYKSYVPAFFGLIARGYATYSAYAGTNSRKSRSLRRRDTSAVCVFGPLDKERTHNIAKHIPPSNILLLRGCCSSAYDKLFRDFQD